MPGRKKTKLESLEDFQVKGKRLEVLIKLCNNIRESERRAPHSFNDFLYHATQEPELVFRSIFQLFHDMVGDYVHIGENGSSITTDSVGFVRYDCKDLFITDCDNPFFADRLFANRFVTLVEDLKNSSINNFIYLFEGPPGSGKSTFLNNLLKKFEIYTNTNKGVMYETLWRIDVDKLSGSRGLSKDIKDNILSHESVVDETGKPHHYLDISCPSHDHPIIQIPKKLRGDFLNELIVNKKFKEKLFNSREYEWVMKDNPCTICNTIYSSLLDVLEDPIEVFKMVNARKVRFSRQFGEGISVFNPGDPLIHNPIGNKVLQETLAKVLKNPEAKILYSYLANTNNGVYALMDIKEQNVDRLTSLHGIVSDGVHKVEYIEEHIKSLFVGLLNPEDKRSFEHIKSFQDRIVTVNIPYVLDYKTEVAIYLDRFSDEIKDKFLPGVLANFAKIIISTRLNEGTPAIKNWISDPSYYVKYTDKNLFLLKMAIYSGSIPEWISDDDLKNYDQQTQREIIEDSETEGTKGFSGRQSLTVFNEFLSQHSKEDKLITMNMLVEYFKENAICYGQTIPEGCIRAIEDQYDYDVVQQVKESLYYYNEKQITRDILNYLYAISFEMGEKIHCEHTGDDIIVSDMFFRNFEILYVGSNASLEKRKQFRKDIHAEYISRTLSQEIKLGGRRLVETEIYKMLFERYVKSLKENALAPYVENENFRRAINDFHNMSFENYDDRLKKDITFMIKNLKKNYGYSVDGARQIVIYIIDKKLHLRY